MATRSTALRDLIEQRRAEILALLDQHKARSIAVVGSVARGDATVDSDVDFLVDFEPWSSLLDLTHLEGALSPAWGGRGRHLPRCLLDRDEEIRRDAMVL